MAGSMDKALRGMLQLSDSQKAFSPWWEDLEGKLLYSLMILGMISLPFNMVSNTPIECILDPNHASYASLSEIARRPQFGIALYLRKYCTVVEIGDSMVLLPFILILMPLPLVGAGQLIMRYFRVEKRLDMFYSLLVKESLDREDVEAMEKENLKDCHEIIQIFRESRSVSRYLLTRAITQLVVGTAILMALLWIFSYGLVGSHMPCQVFGRHYTCVVPLANFYYCICLTALASIVGFLACCAYKLLWFLLPHFLSPFEKFMVRKKEHIDVHISHELSDVKSKKVFTRCLPCVENSRPFFDLYNNPRGPDFGILIKMLAARNGIAEGLRILSLFDNEYQKLWKPLDVQIFHRTMSDEQNISEDISAKLPLSGTLSGKSAITIRWSDAPIAYFVHTYKACPPGPLRVEYTVEVVPNWAVEAPLKSHLFYKDRSSNFIGRMADVEERTATEDEHSIWRENNVYTETFYGPLLAETWRGPSQGFDKEDLSGKECNSGEGKKDKAAAPLDIRIIISTEVNGRTIAQVSEKVPPPPLKRYFESSPVPKSNGLAR